QKRLGEIRTALAVFAAKHGRLPCPRNPLGSAASPGLSRHSMEAISEEEKLCAPEAVAPKGIVVSSAVYQSMEQVHEVWTGVVPAQALKLKETSAKDGWGRPFTYAVSRSLTLPQGL